MKKITYKVIKQKEADLAVRGQEYVDSMIEADDEYEDNFWLGTLVRCEDDVSVEILGEDGGEPEDQIFRRDWSWVAPALQDAFELGQETGYERGYEKGWEDCH